MLNITSEQRRFLRSQAHHLNPIVLIGDAGLTENVIKEIALGLASHELIKIKAHGGDKAVREALMEEICNQLDAASVQIIGKIMVVYKPAEKPKLVLP